MVTQNATSTEETQVSPNPDSLSPVDLSEPVDAPLISPDRVFGPDGVEVGTESQENGGAESPEAGAATTEVEQEKPTGETEASEGPESEQEPEAESEPEAEPEAEPERTYSQEEWNKRQSAIDRQIAEARKDAEEARAQVEQINQQFAQQNVQAQVLAYRDEIKDTLISKGYDEQTALDQANSHTWAVKAAWDAQQELEKAQSELNTLRQSSERASASTVARDMAEKYNVSRDDIPLLSQTQNPEQMEALAKRLGTFNTQLQEQNERLQAEVPTAEEDPIDAGGGRPGGMTDEQKIAAFSRGEYNDFAEVQKILARQGMSPF